MKRRQRLSRQMSLRELANMMGYEGRWAPERLKRQLLRLEKENGVQLMTRLNKGHGRRYVVHLSVLREHVPALFYRRDEAVEALREYVEEWDERLTRVRDEITAVARLAGERISRLEVEIARLKMAQVSATGTMDRSSRSGTSA